jgi:cytochrome P450
VSVPDLGDPLLYASGPPAGLWQQLRRRSRPHWNPPTASNPGFWAFTRYEDVNRGLRDVHRLSSQHGNMLSVAARRGDAGAGRMLVVTDAPRHTALRQLLSRAFTPRTLQRIEAGVRRTVDEILEAAVSLRAVDFVADVAARLPMTVICDLLGVPRSDWEFMASLTAKAFASDESPETVRMVRTAHGEILSYYAQLVLERRRHPKDDVISILATAEIDGVPLSDEEILLNCDNLVIGGNETTRHAACAAALAFAYCPAELDFVYAREAAEAASEEALRWGSPVMHVLRIATSDFDDYGPAIHAGDLVTFWLGAANRDESVFESPDTFSVNRQKRRHLAFGSGPHVCLGSHLAMIELRGFLGAFAAVFREVRLLGEPEWISSTFVSGLRHLPVELVPRGRRPSRRLAT